MINVLIADHFSAGQWLSIAWDTRYWTALHNQSCVWVIDNKTTSRKWMIWNKPYSRQSKLQTNRDPQAKPDACSASEDKTNIPDYLNSSPSKTHITDYFNSCKNKEAVKRASEAISNRIQNEYNNLFSGTDCFEGTFSLQVKGGNYQYQAPPRVPYVLQNLLKEEPEWLQKYCSIRFWWNFRVVQQFCFGTPSYWKRQAMLISSMVK